ncbi:MAG TPA: hypothetical protein VGI79_07080 [Caulobacteraceae bacterium]
MTPQGALNLSAHAYVVESKGVRIIADTCVGNDKPRNLRFFDKLSTPFLKRLAEAGFMQEDIDYPKLADTSAACAPSVLPNVLPAHHDEIHDVH